VITFIVWDVQHVQAAYLKTPNSHFVFDLGTGSYGYNGEFSPFSYLRNHYGVKKLDGVLLSHPHRDHLDDIKEFDSPSPSVLWRPSHLSESDIRKANRDHDTWIQDAYLEINKRYSDPITDEINPFLPQNNGGVQMQIFTPNTCATSNISNHSFVTVVTHENYKLLIPGDNESISWDELLERSDFCSAIDDTDVLLAHHHGRKAGFSEKLFEHIPPRIVIVSDERFADTSATDQYSKKAQRWKVDKRSGDSNNRKCLTTLKDGVIVTKFGLNSENRPFIEITAA